MDVHYVENENITVAFFPETKRFFKVNKNAILLINAIISGKEKEQILSDFNISSEDCDIYYNNIYGGITKPTAIITEKSKKRILNRLVIHLTNDCNMRCKYCYANGGNYFSKRSILEKGMMDAIIDCFFKEFEIIEGIQFFGGEPLMNYPMLEYGCKQISKIATLRGYTVNFGIVTNGTLVNDTFINLVNKYNINVTVSYDGNPFVNDIMRIMQDGKGSSDIILRNAKELKKKTGQPTTIEVTYNQFHVDNSVDILDVINHISSELPNTYIHLVPAGGDEKCDYSIKNLKIFSQSITQILQRVKMKGENIPNYSLAQRIFWALENRNNDISKICDAGFGTMSVSIMGDVYPCFMFTDNPQLCYGNITNQNLFYSKQYAKIKEQIEMFSNKSKNLECQKCFIKSLCNGCLGLNAFHSGSPFELSKDICQMFRDMTDQALLEYAELQYNTTREG